MVPVVNRGWGVRRSTGGQLFGLVCTAFVCGASLPGSATAQTEPASPIRWEQPADEDLALSASTEINLVSDGVKDETVALEVVLGELKLSDGGSVAGTTIVRVPPSVEVAALQTAAVPITVLGLDGIDLTTGGRGRIIATAGDREAVLSFQLVDPSDPAGPEPLATTWAATITRDACGDQSITGDVLPLEKKFSDELPDAPLGVLQDDDGDEVVVRGVLAADGMSIKLDFGDDVGSGETYSGTLDLAPDDDESGAIEFTLHATHTRMTAALVMIGGVVLGLFVKWIAGVVLIVRGMKKRLGNAAIAAGEQQAKFTHAVGENGPGAGWTIEPAVTAALADGEAALGRIKRLRTLGVDKSSAEFVIATEALETLNAAKDWGPEVAQEAAGLQAAIDEVAPKPIFANGPPAVLATARAHLGAATVALDQITTFRSATVALTTSVLGLPALTVQNDERTTALKNIPTGPSAGDARIVARVLRDLAALRYRLERAATVDELAALEIDRRVAAADEVIGALSAAPILRADAAHNLRTLQALSMLRGLDPIGLLIAPASVSPTVGDKVRRALSTFTRFTGTAVSGAAALLVIGVAFAAAVATGLAEVYGDGPFGTGFDFVEAFGWGVATAAVVQAIESVISAFSGTTASTSSEESS